MDVLRMDSQSHTMDLEGHGGLGPQPIWEIPAEVIRIADGQVGRQEGPHAQ